MLLFGLLLLFQKPPSERREGCGVEWGRFRRPGPSQVLPPRATQPSPLHSAPLPPLRDLRCLNPLHTGIHKKPTLRAFPRPYILWPALYPPTAPANLSRSAIVKCPSSAPGNEGLHSVSALR